MKPESKSRRASIAALALVVATTVSSTFAAPADNVADILKLTNGRRVKAAWNSGGESDKKLMLLDTKDGEIIEVPFGGSAPLLSIDGRHLFASTGKAPERMVMMYDTETKKVTELAPKGPSNNLLATWQDPKTKRNWVYVNDSGDKNEGWDKPAGAIHRFPVDKPEERELFWDRTSSHIYLMFSADGTRACFEPSWANIGQLKIALTPDGKIDQEKSEYKGYGGGCFPSMAPDNSYRLFRLDGDHRAITMSDAENENPRKVDVTGALFGAAGNTWLTRWSTDPRFITLVAPAGNSAKICMGRLDEGATKFEDWVRISPADGPQCWQSHVWIEPAK